MELWVALMYDNGWKKMPVLCCGHQWILSFGDGCHLVTISVNGCYYAPPDVIGWLFLPPDVDLIQWVPIGLDELQWVLLLEDKCQWRMQMKHDVWPVKLGCQTIMEAERNHNYLHQHQCSDLVVDGQQGYCGWRNRRHYQHFFCVLINSFWREFIIVIFVGIVNFCSKLLLLIVIFINIIIRWKFLVQIINICWWRILV